MKLAIMQPYFFPYLGYWQLLNLADRFVIYDDVNYIKRGWVNRNRILINGKPSYITVPLNQLSQNKRICDISLQPALVWRRKMIRTIENTYRKSPYFFEIFPVIEKLVNYEADSLSEFLSNHLMALATVLGIKTSIVITSRSYHNDNLSGQERIIDICKREDASIYINLQGGQELYDVGIFRKSNIELRFVAMRSVPYSQRYSGFFSHLSIIDVLMGIGAQGVRQNLNKFDQIMSDGSHVQ